MVGAVKAVPTSIRRLNGITTMYIKDKFLVELDGWKVSDSNGTSVFLNEEPYFNEIEQAYESNFGSKIELEETTYWDGRVIHSEPVKIIIFDTKSVPNKKKAAKALHEAGYSIRAIMGMLGYKSPKSIQDLLKEKQDGN